MFTEDPPDKILYCYGIFQDLYREMEQSTPGITFLEGLPSKSEIEDFTCDKTSPHLRARRYHASTDSRERYGITIHTRMPS